LGEHVFFHTEESFNYCNSSSSARYFDESIIVSPLIAIPINYSMSMFTYDVTLTQSPSSKSCES